MVNKEMKFLDNGDVRYEIVDEAARSNIQTINTVLDTKADTSNVTALDTRVTGVEEDRYKPYVTDSTSGAVASFTDGADDLPLKSLVVDINPVQSGSGDPSPENICPISGWTGCEVQHDGKNLLTYVPNKITAPLSVTLDKSRATLVKKGITYTMSFDMQNATTWRICAILFDLEGNRHFVNDEHPFGIVNPYLLPNASGQYYVWGGNYTFKSFVITPIDDFYVMFFFLLGDTSASTIMVNPMLEVGSTATDYEPYAGQTIPISWQTEAGTVYGGKLDVLSGELVIDRAMVDLGTLSWNKNESLNLFYTNISNAKYVASAKGTPCECSALASVRDMTWSGWSNFPDYAIAVGNNFATGSYNTTVKMSNYDSPDALKTAMSGVQLCYELAAPITIQLTPHEVKSLLGQNNIWADTGDCTVEYRADTKMYIERLTEPDADMIADSNITSGSYFMVGNSLYLATTNIANGGQIIVGTNCTKVSLATALNEINA